MGKPGLGDLGKPNFSIVPATAEKPVRQRQSIVRKIGILICLGFLGLFVLFSIEKISKKASFQFFGNLTAKVDTSEKVVALSFDDGPTVGKTEEILEILNQNNVKATFYLVGNEIACNMDQTKKIISQGHEVGNHSYTHPKMIFKSYKFVREELENTSALIRKAGYQKELTFRPPYGIKLFVLPYYLMKNEIRTVTWDVAPDSDLPFDATPEELVKYTVENVKPGSIILMHVMFDSRINSMSAVPGLIKELKNRGYRFVTVSELMNEAKA